METLSLNTHVPDFEEPQQSLNGSGGDDGPSSLSASWGSSPSTSGSNQSESSVDRSDDSSDLSDLFTAVNKSELEVWNQRQIEEMHVPRVTSPSDETLNSSSSSSDLSNSQYFPYLNLRGFRTVTEEMEVLVEWPLDSATQEVYPLQYRPISSLNSESEWQQAVQNLLISPPSSCLSAVAKEVHGIIKDDWDNVTAYFEMEVTTETNKFRTLQLIPYAKRSKLEKMLVLDYRSKIRELSVFFSGLAVEMKEVVTPTSLGESLSDLSSSSSEESSANDSDPEYVPLRYAK